MHRYLLFLDAFIYSAEHEYGMHNGSTRIWSTTLDCAGNELELSNCLSTSPVDTNSCTFSKDIGIRCFSK